MLNITTNHAITYTNRFLFSGKKLRVFIGVRLIPYINPAYHHIIAVGVNQAPMSQKRILNVDSSYLLKRTDVDLRK